MTRGTLDPVQIFPRTRLEQSIEVLGGEIIQEIIEAGGQYFTYDGHIPCNLMVFDEMVVIENNQVEGVQGGTVVESKNGVVREWALEVLEHYREESEEVTLDDFPE